MSRLESGLWVGLVMAVRLLCQRLGLLPAPAPPAPPQVAPVAPPAPVAVRIQPPPIPAAARRRPTPAQRKMTEQELAWQELMSGRHPRSLTRLRARPASSDSTAAPA